ncbi:MAG TPA: D-alanyl-D-alanine carboxypeptidase/D-alanyl-D-alanine-endopeptidase [Nannocystis exedens]|nr:D-alanyl-D-alanine carboxypeptidase/D-alanyl-D-alanine-endopeptidase [Nannocystis exedens]
MGSFLVELVLAGATAISAPLAPLTSALLAEAKAPLTTAVQSSHLGETIDRILDHKRLATATIGVVVIDTANGEVLYSRNPDTPVNPASNIKLLTTAAALSILGPEHRYVTRLFVRRDALRGDTIHGDLYLKGGGDPWLVTGDLYELAGDLHALGVRRITGGIIIDSSAFDRDELPPVYDQKDEFASYRAMSSAASVNFNTFVVHMYPGSALGQAATVSLDPALPSITLQSKTATVEGRRNQALVSREIDREGGLSLNFSGSLGIDAAVAHFRYPVADPSKNAGAILALVLGQRGIRIGKGAIRKATVPKGARALLSRASRPLSALCRGVNKHSNNFMAEQILKTLDLHDERPATFEGALARVREHLEGLGIESEGLQLKNGSGLYDANRITASQLAQLLVATYNDFRVSSDFLASLPISGVDGTMRRRLRDSAATRYVRAKTGTLNESSALSGYAGAPSRPPIAFSILIGEISRGKTQLARSVQNQIAEELAALAARRARGPRATSNSDLR